MGPGTLFPNLDHTGDPGRMFQHAAYTINGVPKLTNEQTSLYLVAGQSNQRWQECPADDELVPDLTCLQRSPELLLNSAGWMVVDLGSPGEEESRPR